MAYNSSPSYYVVYIEWKMPDYEKPNWLGQVVHGSWHNLWAKEQPKWKREENEKPDKQFAGWTINTYTGRKDFQDV